VKEIYICSPFRADDDVQFEKQLEYTKAVAREVVLLGFDVVVPHLLYPRFLDADCEAERELGLGLALNSLEKCDMVIVNTLYGISEGIKREMAKAQELHVDIVIAKDVCDVKPLLKMVH